MSFIKMNCRFCNNNFIGFLFYKKLTIQCSVSKAMAYYVEKPVEKIHQFLRNIYVIDCYCMFTRL